MAKKKEIIIGSRGSKLALIQTNWVISELKKFYPDYEFQIKKISTSGDKITDVPLSRLGGVGIFTKELEVSLINEKIDIAVHSAKDIPTEIPSELTIGAMPKRVDPSDVLISTHNVHLEILLENARIGTSSLRRKAQLLALRPDFEIVDLRGNLNTRLKKVETEDLDAIILAHAGLIRMGYTGQISQVIPFDIMLPAVGQGSLGIEIRKNDERIRDIVAKLDDSLTRGEVEAERALLAKLQGGCQVPIGAYAKINGTELHLEAVICTLDGDHTIRDSLTGPADQPVRIGNDLASSMLESGGDKILQGIRDIFSRRANRL